MKYLICLFLLFPTLSFAEPLAAQTGSTLKIFDSLSKKWMSETLIQVELNYVIETNIETLSSISLRGETRSCEIQIEALEAQRIPIQMIVDFLQSRRIDAHCWLSEESQSAKNFSFRTYIE